MSVELIVEVLKYAPESLNPTERLTLVTIAESCRTDGRMTFYRDGWDAEELARRVGITAESLTKVFRSLAAKGCEVRVPHMVKDGKPIFAFKGKQTTFKLPRFAPQRVDESPGFSEEGEAKGWTSVRQSLDERPGKEAQSLDESPPLLLKDLPSKNPSSLSGEGATDPGPPVVTAQPEREIEEASRRSKTHQLLFDAGCPDEHLDDVEEELRRRFEVRSPQWFRTVAGNDELAGHVADVLDALNPPRPGMTNTGYKASLAGEPLCPHQEPGGNIPRDGDGWMHCAGCRLQAGWVAVNNQGRTDNKDPHRKRSTSALRAEQALEVVDNLDRQFGHGKYAPGVIRSPADQRVADAGPLYDHYRRLELEGESA